MMMKRLLPIAIVLLVVGLPIADAAAPSNVTGYTAIYIQGTTTWGRATPFGLAFKFWDVDAGIPQYGTESFRPSDIIGDQAIPGGPIDAEKVVKQGGNQAYRDNSGGPVVWTDPLEDNAEMIPGDAYWFVTIWPESRYLFLCGGVDNSGNYGTTTITAPMATAYYATPYTWRDSRNVPVDSLGLLEQGFTGDATAIASDKVVMQGGSGLQLNYIEGVGWDYGFTHIVPGVPYWIVNKHVGHPWNYAYVGVPALPFFSSDDESVVTGTEPQIPVKSRATVRATSSVKKDAPKTSKKSSKASK